MVEINLINPDLDNTYSVTISGEHKQQACSYKAIFTDTTTISNPQYSFGSIIYYTLDTDGNETQIATSNINSTATAQLCEEGVYTIRKRIIIQETVNNCPSRVLYQEYVDFNIVIREWYPLFKFPEHDCCYLKGVEIVSNPSEININNNACVIRNVDSGGFFTEQPPVELQVESVSDGGAGFIVVTSTNHNIPVNSLVTLNTNVSLYNNQFKVTSVTDNTFTLDISPSNFTTTATGTFTLLFPGRFSSGFASWNDTEEGLLYELFYYDFDINEYVKITETSYGGLTLTDPEAYPFTFTPDRLTRYKLKASYSNCCTIRVEEKEFLICDSIVVKPACSGKIECNECETYYIDNFTDETLNVEVWNGITNKKIVDFDVEGLKRKSYSFDKDGVYVFKYTTDEEYNIVLPVLCKIDKCYTNLLKVSLCAEAKSGCCDDRYLDNRLANVQAFYQTFLHAIEPYTDLNLRFAKADITNQLDDFKQIGLLINQILDFCDVCKRNTSNCIDWESSKCL